MRVLHLIPNMLSGGAQQHLCYLAAAQHAAGFEVHVAIFLPGPKLARLRETNAAVHRLRGAGNHDPRLLGEIVSLVHGLRPDVVQTWLNQMDVLGGLAARWTGRPWVVCEQASAPAYAGSVKGSIRAFLARGADAIVSNSEQGNRYWASRIGPRPLRRVIRNGVPLREIESTNAASAAAIGLPQGNRMVLYVGRFSPQKNLEALVPALGEVARRLPATAYLCGDGTHEAETKALIASLCLEREVRLVGYVDDVWSWMKRADVFVSVSHFEGSPNTLFEAAACGIPLVLSDIPEHREILDESGALFVSRSSPDEIADAIERTLREPEEAARRAKVARSVVASYSVEAMAGGYDDVYREVLDRRRAGRIA